MYCTYLLNSRRTTQMMTNMRAIAANIPIIAGSMYCMLGMGSFLAGTFNTMSY